MTISSIKKHEANINIYENIDFLEKPGNISILDKNCLTDSDYVVDKIIRNFMNN